MENGKIVCWKLTKVRRGSIYVDLGLKESDCIESINGTRLNDASKAVGFLNGLIDESRINIKYKRGKNSQQLNIDVE